MSLNYYKYETEKYARTRGGTGLRSIPFGFYSQRKLANSRPPSVSTRDTSRRQT